MQLKMHIFSFNNQKAFCSSGAHGLKLQIFKGHRVIVNVFLP